ncbi:MAG: hypothetical protein JWQ35_2297 [Bacteriovoracaceae bacterium]|nr:hypothetical protein [Bacteriovoracaceae bacterium]
MSKKSVVTVKDRLASQSKERGIEFTVKNASYLPAIEAVDRTVADALSEPVLQNSLPTNGKWGIALSLMGQKTVIQVNGHSLADKK